MSQPTLIGTTLAHYQILELIGQGGMATVYLAEDQKHNRKVALKVMKPERAAAIGQDRFLREIETAARILGAVDRSLGEIEGKLEKMESTLYEKTETQLKSEMGEEPYQAAFEEGRKLSWTDAIELA